jgi:hypothetical protein
MSYRNKTYVIFDGDNDMWAYAYMKGWIQHEHIAFDFHDAHDLKPLTRTANDETVFARLRERMADTKQAVVLVGEYTKNPHKFVRWELERVLKNDVPLIVVNLNQERSIDRERCPAIIRDEYVVHVAFRAKIVQYVLDNFPDFYARRAAGASGPLHYNNKVYADLGLD